MFGVGCVVKVGGSVTDTILALGSVCICILSSFFKSTLFPGTSHVLFSYILIKCVILFPFGTILGGGMGLWEGGTSSLECAYPCFCKEVLLMGSRARKKGYLADDFWS